MLPISFDADLVLALQEDLGIDDPTHPNEDMQGAIIQLMARAIADRSGLSENQSIGAAEDVFYRVIVPLQLQMGN